MRLLATDLDGTFVGHPEALRDLTRWLADHRDRWRLAYVTGRSLPSARGLAKDEGLPEPDVWVTEVGTVITDPEGTEDTAWRSKLETGWDRAIVERVVSDYPALRVQPPENQGPFKVSYFLDPADAAELMAALKSRLAEQGIAVRLVYSSDRDLDVLPAVAGKGEAVKHLLTRFGIPLDQALVCGDSGNDRDMLCLGGPAVAVGNAQRELLEDLPASVFRARGRCAEGIMEALRHYGWVATGEPSSTVDP